MKYELLKDLPGQSAGTVFERREDGKWYVVGFPEPSPYSNILENFGGFSYFTDFFKELPLELKSTVDGGCDCDICKEDVAPATFPSFDGLNPVQAEHRKDVVVTAMNLIHDKYTRGAMEHKTNLKQDTTLAQLVDFALEEMTDGMTYLITIKQKLADGEEW